MLEFIEALIREKEILESYEAYEAKEDIDINNTQNLKIMNKVTFNWANALIVITTALTGVMSCITIVQNKVNFNTEKFVHEILPTFVAGILNCIEFPKEN